jgi:hypothetical protein
MLKNYDKINIRALSVEWSGGKPLGFFRRCRSLLSLCFTLRAFVLLKTL